MNNVQLKTLNKSLQNEKTVVLDNNKAVNATNFLKQKMETLENTLAYKVQQKIIDDTQKELAGHSIDYNTFIKDDVKDKDEEKKQLLTLINNTRKKIVLARNQIQLFRIGEIDKYIDQINEALKEIIEDYKANNYLILPKNLGITSNADRDITEAVTEKLDKKLF